MRSLLSGLVDYWPLHEASGDRGSATGLHALTDNNTVGQSAGKVLYNADFVAASSESLSIASAAELDPGDTDFTWACWLQTDLENAFRYAIAKYNGTNASSAFFLAYASAPDRFQAAVMHSTGITQLNADSLGAVSAATWYFLVFWHDSVANTLNIEGNMTGVDSTATGGAINTSSLDIRLGGRSDSASFWDGRMCEVGFWGRILTPQERWWLPGVYTPPLG